MSHLARFAIALAAAVAVPQAAQAIPNLVEAPQGLTVERWAAYTSAYTYLSGGYKAMLNTERACWEANMKDVARGPALASSYCGALAYSNAIFADWKRGQERLKYGSAESRDEHLGAVPEYDDDAPRDRFIAFAASNGVAEVQAKLYWSIFRDRWLQFKYALDEFGVTEMGSEYPYSTVASPKPRTKK